MKHHIFILFCILITSLCAYSQEIPMLTEELNSENVINPFHQSSVTSSSINSDFNESTTMSFNYKHTQEWGKYKALRAVGWSAFGIGVPATLVGLFLCGVAMDAAPAVGTAAAIVTISGGALTLSSIPLLISAYHYRNKAKKMALNVGVTSITTPSISKGRDYTPGLSFALNF